MREGGEGRMEGEGGVGRQGEWRQGEGGEARGGIGVEGEGRQGEGGKGRDGRGGEGEGGQEEGGREGPERSSGSVPPSLFARVPSIPLRSGPSLTHSLTPSLPPSRSSGSLPPSSPPSLPLILFKTL